MGFPSPFKKPSLIDICLHRKDWFSQWSLTGNINHLREGPMPSSRWLTQNELDTIFVDFLFLSHMALSENFLKKSYWVD